MTGQATRESSVVALDRREAGNDLTAAVIDWAIARRDGNPGPAFAVLEEAADRWIEANG
ncbi:hypothetical protein GCM10010401_07070 [Rarobacter faecitabidus]|uniref:Uncharacterized protein n=1 Tax=Rarobacter faecitabidus TaxID=13243 RepID=A0A542ZT73_RARFA|nr:hypothetical protein [Rarobacter faecitabidus]TQL63545.1 hypothetical protein FB461_0004 [Rarobacter faecitabidus]